MESLEQKIQVVRNVCRQLEGIDAELSCLQDRRLMDEYEQERRSKLEQLSRLLSDEQNK